MAHGFCTGSLIGGGKLANLTITVTDQGPSDFSAHWAEVTFHFETVDGRDAQTIYLPIDDAERLESALRMYDLVMAPLFPTEWLADVAKGHTHRHQAHPVRQAERSEGPVKRAP